METVRVHTPGCTPGKPCTGEGMPGDETSFGRRRETGMMAWPMILLSTPKPPTVFKQHTCTTMSEFRSVTLKNIFSSHVAFRSLRTTAVLRLTFSTRTTQYTSDPPPETPASKTCAWRSLAFRTTTLQSASFSRWCPLCLSVSPRSSTAEGANTARWSSSRRILRSASLTPSFNACLSVWKSPMVPVHAPPPGLLGLEPLV
mmetsp:Transcript_5240/g.13343  ORF Transcript_5240/g.13343 Transcript_5240/m.13343 type:complete len:201 (-) Transcript_5240:209-811(-)